jgi:malate synthase
MVRNDILQKFPDLFGSKQVNGRPVNVEEAITALTRELRPAIAAALTARRELMESPAPVREKYAWPRWEEKFEDPISGQPWSFRQIVQGLIDNFLGRESPWRWRLNDEVPVPKDAHPLRNPGLELTGPWHPLDMAFNALNSPAPMNMPDFEDASPPHFQPDGTPANQPVGVFAALQNAKEIFAGNWNNKPYQVVKKGKTREYRIAKPQGQWPTRFGRPPGLHINYDHILVDGRPAPATIVITTLWAFNNFDALRNAGSGVYFYIPKLQTPQEALIVEKILSHLEGMAGVPAGTIKIKMLYEEGNAGRTLPAIAWTLRRRLLGTNVGRWDYLGSLIEMWKDDPQGIYPDPQSIGMSSPNMIGYQRYNALIMLMAGMKNGELENAAPIGGMAAVMIYQPSDAYGRSKYNPLALRAMVIDKLRERMLGLIFVPDQPLGTAQQPTLEDILAKRVKGRLYDCYRQSWVASPEPDYVASGNKPLQVPLEQLQAILDALLPQKSWDVIYGVPKGDVTIERIQHAFYMAANYGFQILNGNFAAAIDDYELKLRFMNDLATYRIDVSWLWTLLRHQAAITKDGHLKRPALTEDGVEPAANAEQVKAGSRFTRELFDKLWTYHNEWTQAFFAEQDRRGDPGRFDRGKADLIMEILRKQLLSPRYIQHSARVLFVVGQAGKQESSQLLEAIFDLTREEIQKRVQADTLDPAALAAHDYVFDIFPEVAGKKAPAQETAAD